MTTKSSRSGTSGLDIRCDISSNLPTHDAARVLLDFHQQCISKSVASMPILKMVRNRSVYEKKVNHVVRFLLRNHNASVREAMLVAEFQKNTSTWMRGKTWGCWRRHIWIGKIWMEGRIQRNEAPKGLIPRQQIYRRDRGLRDTGV